LVGWIILGVLVALIAAILLIPVGVDAGYEGGELRVSAKVAGFLLQLIPKKEPRRPKKEKKPKKPKKKKEKKPEDEEEQEEETGEKKGLPLGLTKEDLLELVKTVFRGLGRFRRKLSVDRFLLHFTAAWQDPYNTAMLFGYVNEALSILAPLSRQAFRVRRSDVRTEVDFVGEEMKIDFGLALTIRIGQILGVVNAIVFGALGILLRRRRANKKAARLAEKEAKTAGELPADAIETEKETTAIQDEERMEANG